MKPCQGGKYNSLSLRASEGRNPSERSNLFLFAITIAVFAFCFFGSDFAFAASGTTLDFDGTSDYLVASDNAVFDQADRLSISVWIQPDDTPGGDEYIVYRFDDYYLKMNSSRKIIASVHTDAETVTSTSAITCDGVEWTHIEMTYDKDAGGTDEIKIYINGVLDAVGDYSTANAVSAELLYIGAADTDGVGAGVISNWFDGKIDDVRLYQYARSASDVRLDYNDGLAARFGGLTSHSSGGQTSTLCDRDPASCMDYGLVGHWNMDEAGGDTLYDQSDNGNDGTLGSGAGADTADPKWVATSGRGLTSHSSGGQTSTALLFDGKNDYVNCGNDSSLNITDAITIEAWVKFPTVDSQDVIAMKGSGGIGGKRYALYTYNDGKITWGVDDDIGIGWKQVKSANDIDDDMWHYLVGVVDGNTLRLYIDSLEETPTDITGLLSTVDASKNFTIGISSNDESAQPFNGSIDGVKIYNRALSAEEVRYHYNRGGPVAHWKFDEGEGAKAYDESGNRNHGTFGDGTCLPGAGKCPTWVAGKHSSTLSFDGTDDYINCGSDPSLDITDAITIEAWVKPDGNLDQYDTILESDDAGRGYRIWSPSGTNTIGATLHGPSGNNVISTITINSWNHIVATYDNANHILYVNGVSVDTEPRSGDIIYDSLQFIIGKDFTEAGRHANGSIDGVKIYNYARTAEQILVDYNNGLGTHIK